MKSIKSGWSFCIVTAQGNEEVLQQCVEKIHSVFSQRADYEIIIVGNPIEPNRFTKENSSVLPFNENVFFPSFNRSSILKCITSKSLKPLLYKTGAICHKKNLAASKATYDKLCIMHDYIGIENNWLNGFNEFGEDWDICMNIVQNQDGKRHRDWMAWDHPRVTDKKTGAGACLISYDKYTKYMYISGAYFCVKNSFYSPNPLCEKLFWGQGEDIEWSLRVREKTKFKMNKKSTVKYLKMKPIDDAPNCDSWIKTGIIMDKVLSDPQEK